MSEVELIDKGFITKVSHVKTLPIDREAYEQSRIGIQRAIWRLTNRLKRMSLPGTHTAVKIKVEKLKLIDKYLQKALEL
jgi:hypothetical protein